MNEKLELPMLPLRGVVVFPHVVIHLDVGRESSLNALNEAMLGDNLIVLVAQKEAKIEDPGEGDLNSVGTIATIKQVLKLPGGSNRILVEGTGRVRINRIVVSKPFFSAEVERLLDDELKTIETEAFMRAVLTQFEEYARQTKKIPPEAMVMAREILRQLDSIYHDYLNLGTEEILKQWREFNITLGKKVTIKSLRETFSGVALGIDQMGALIVAGSGGGQKRFITGEIIN
jgi:ATP-dependent Lon protease